MARFLLLPADELALLVQLLEVDSLMRLAHDDLTYGPPVAGPPASPPPLPDAPQRVTFWVPALGELRTLDGGSRLDRERSPILTWQRSSWHATGALRPGRLTAQARPRKDQPKALLRVHEAVERWLKREGTKLNPFDHAPDDPPVERPENEKPYAVFALPHACRWVGEGGSIWPWDD